MVGKNRGVRNRIEGERKDTREERELSTRGIMVIQLCYNGYTVGLLMQHLKLAIVGIQA